MRRLTFAAILMFTSCSGPTGPALSLNLSDLPATVTLRVGQSADVGGILVRFGEVRGDSRCPQNATCVWEGNAEVVLVVGEAGTRTGNLLSLNTTLEPRSGTALGLSLALEGLAPIPIAGAGRERPEYRATIRIGKQR